MTDTTDTTAAATNTRYFVFKPHTEGEVKLWEYMGSHEASHRDAALRKQFGAHVPTGAVAVSEHAWQPKKPNVVPVVRGLTDFDMPLTPVIPEPTEDRPLADESTLLPRAQVVPEDDVPAEPAVA